MLKKGNSFNYRTTVLAVVSAFICNVCIFPKIFGILRLWRGWYIWYENVKW